MNNDEIILDLCREAELNRYLDRLYGPKDEEDMSTCERCQAGLLGDEFRMCGEISCKSFECSDADRCENDESLCDCERELCVAFQNRNK